MSFGLWGKKKEEEKPEELVMENSNLADDFQAELDDFLDLPTEKEPEIEPEIEPEKESEKESEPEKEEEEEEEKEEELSPVGVEGEETEKVIPEDPTEPLSEIDALKEQVTKLMGVVSELGSAKGAKKEEVTPIEPENVVNLKSHLAEMDFDKVMDSKEDFVAFLSKTIAITREETKQAVLESLPSVVDGRVQQVSSMESLAKSFYTTHPELSNIKGYVSTVASELAAKNPNMTVEEVLNTAATAVKAQLGLTKVAQTNNLRPTLGGGTNSVKSKAAKKSDLQSEIDEMLED